MGAAGLAYAVASNTLSLSTLPSLGIQLSNSFGLFCVLTLLGYGLVAIPKHLWKRSFPERELRHQLYRCAYACLSHCHMPSGVAPHCSQFAAATRAITGVAGQRAGGVVGGCRNGVNGARACA